jgi:hypothetical protein
MLNPAVYKVRTTPIVNWQDTWFSNNWISHIVVFWVMTLCNLVPGCWWVLSPTRKETSYSDRRFCFSYILFIIIIGGILVLFIYITRLASKEIFSPSNKIHRQEGRAKDLPAPLYVVTFRRKLTFPLLGSKLNVDVTGDWPPIQGVEPNV